MSAESCMERSRLAGIFILANPLYESVNCGFLNVTAHHRSCSVEYRSTYDLLLTPCLSACQTQVLVYHNLAIYLSE